jgi:hypothetical protein
MHVFLSHSAGETLPSNLVFAKTGQRCVPQAFGVSLDTQRTGASRIIYLDQPRKVEMTI